MSVTCELWAYIEQYGGKLMSNRQAEELATIAEHIDQAHESAMYDMRREHDEWVADRDANWVKLPLDADGMPIRVGDVMENVVSPSIHREVTGVGVECFYAWEDGFGRYSQFDAPNYRHHHEPTVEDVLREFAEKVIDSQIPSVHPTYEEAIAEYAAKLRLAGDAE